MVEIAVRPSELILNPEEQMNMIQLKQSLQTNNFIGARVLCKEKIYSYPNADIFDQDIENTTNFQVDIQDETYLNEILLYESLGCIQMIQFKLHYTKDNKPVQQSYTAGSCNTPNPLVNKISAKGGHSLAISKLKFTNVLVGIETEQKLLNNFTPTTLIKKFDEGNQSFLFNLSDLKKLEGLIPKKGFVEDEEFKSLYEALRKAIIQIDSAKRELSDIFQENIYFMRRLEETYHEIASAVIPVLQRGAGRFRPEEFEREKIKLKELVQHLNTLTHTIQKLAQKISSLREVCSSATELRNQLFSNEGVSMLLRQYQTEESISFSRRTQLDKIRIQIKDAQRVLEFSEKMLETKQAEAESLTQILSQKEMQKTDFIERSSQTDQHLEQIKQDDYGSIQELTNKTKKLEEDLENNIQQLEQNFKKKSLQIEEQIMKERSKISSKNMQARSNHHFIFILDESGSMTPEWEKLRASFNAFIESYKENEDDMFSVVLFDNGGRIAFKRKKAKDISDIGGPNGGGTQFYPAMQLVKQMVDLTPSNMSPILIFMTDGSTSTSDVKQACKVLDEIAKSSIYKNGGIFFTIGFGTGYQMSTLQDICSSANNKKHFVEIGGDKIELIMEAINGDELQSIFMGISNSFDCRAQEAAISMLEQQRGLDENTYKQQENMYREQFKQRLEQLQEHANSQASLKKLATENKTQEIQEFLAAKINQYTTEIQQIREDLERVIGEEAQLEVEIEVKQKDLTYHLTKEKEFMQKLEKQEKEEDKNDEIMTQQTNDLVRKSKLQDIEGVRTMYNYLGSVDGIVENLNTAYRSSKNLLFILKSKIEDLIYQFEGHFIKTVIKGLDDSLIAMRIIESYHLPDELANKQSREVLEAVLLKSSKKSFEENKHFYNILFKVLDLGALATSSKKKISKYAKEYANKLKIQDSKGGEDEDSDKSSDDEDSGSEKGASKPKTEDIQKEGAESEIQPIYKDDYEKEILKLKKKLSKIKGKRAEAKKSMNKEEYSTAKKEFAKLKKDLQGEITFYRKRLDETQLTQTIEECLRNIFEILQKAIGKDIQTRVFERFKNIFYFFQNNVQKKLAPYEEGANYLMLQNQSDINREIEKINQMKVQQVLEATGSQEDQSNSALNQLEY